MRRLVNVVQETREGIKNVVAVAEGVKDGIQEVVQVNNAPSKNSNGVKKSEGFEEERQLAKLLAEAFQDRNGMKPLSVMMRFMNLWKDLMCLRVIPS